MALKSTVVKAELQISDMDRHYYATHNLTLAQHPSETDSRLMVRLLAFALYADEYLEFGRGLSQDDEPDLWRKQMTGEIEQWIDLGQPDEARIRKACGRSRQVVVVTYAGRSADIWWEKNANSLQRSKNLTVIDIATEPVAELTALLGRSMRLNVMIQDGEMQVLCGEVAVSITPTVRQAATQGL
ncbi:MAG: YaeQ family protein [Pseudoxanthomonas sp.]|nr:YaeQ family protein [Pseudoxanthomonas sp.]